MEGLGFSTLGSASHIQRLKRKLPIVRRTSECLKKENNLIGILPLELSFDHKIYKKLGMSLSAFTDLNLTEIMGGLILNLKIDFNL